MKYVVMECHPAYAVVLDENGKFIKVANMHYEIGQTVTDITEIAVPQAAPKRKLNIKMLSSFAAAACLILVFIPLLIFNNIPFASVYMKINPEVRIDVDKQETVVGLKAVNNDGKVLIEGYEFKDKSLDTVVNELVDRAIELEYLKEGGTVSVTLEADDDVWMESKREEMGTGLTEHLTEKMPVNVEVKEKHRHHHHDDDDEDEDDEDEDDEGLDDDYDHGDHDEDEDREDHDEDEGHEDHDEDEDHEDHEGHDKEVGNDEDEDHEDED